ncbi:hypothetical protein MHU86_9727 [Fragilaria crotonensis]|nr:hypothetical protein MHU86_9727 [Fragilaria crotonensis]
MLEVLGMGENKRMSGVLPDELFGLTGLDEYVYILGNDFVGTIPSSIGGMINLRVLVADFNSFNGTLPTEIGLCTSLEELGLSGSDISSTIPTEIGLLRNLSALSLGDKLQGTIPSELGNCANMTQLVAPAHQPGIRRHHPVRTWEAFQVGETAAPFDVVDGNHARGYLLSSF